MSNTARSHNGSNLGKNVYFDKTNNNYKIKFFKNGRTVNVTSTKDVNKANAISSLIEATRQGIFSTNNLASIAFSL